VNEPPFPLTGMSPEAIEELRPLLHRVLDAILDRAKRPSATLQLTQQIDAVPAPRPSDPSKDLFLNMGSWLAVSVKDLEPLYSAEEIDELLSKGEESET